MYIARKDCWEKLWSCLENEIATLSHQIDVIILKGLKSVMISPSDLECENNLACESYHFQVLNFTFDPCFKVMLGYHTLKSSYLPYICMQGFKI